MWAPIPPVSPSTARALRSNAPSCTPHTPATTAVQQEHSPAPRQSLRPLIPCQVRTRGPACGRKTPVKLSTMPQCSKAAMPPWCYVPKGPMARCSDAGYCFLTRGEGGGGAGQAQPTPPPTHIRKLFLSERMKFMKGARNLRPTFGTRPFFQLLTLAPPPRPPPPPQGG